jgi:hypothetical protein
MDIIWIHFKEKVHFGSIESRGKTKVHELFIYVIVLVLTLPGTWMSH